MINRQVASVSLPFNSASSSSSFYYFFFFPLDLDLLLVREKKKLVSSLFEQQQQPSAEKHTKLSVVQQTCSGVDTLTPPDWTNDPQSLALPHTLHYCQRYNLDLLLLPTTTIRFSLPNARYPTTYFPVMSPPLPMDNRRHLFQFLLTFMI